MALTACTGNAPTDVSALSITASAPSSTALATSLTSARVGTECSIIDSIICVATMTGRPSNMHLLMMSFCTNGTSCLGISTPKSPRATMTASVMVRISSKSSKASGFSIFATIRACLPAASIRLRRSMMSLELRTKESPTQSTSFSKANAKSASSFSVMHGSEIAVEGKLIPFLGFNLPP